MFYWVFYFSLPFYCSHLSEINTEVAVITTIENEEHRAF